MASQADKNIIRNARRSAAQKHGPKAVGYRRGDRHGARFKKVNWELDRQEMEIEHDLLAELQEDLNR